MLIDGICHQNPDACTDSHKMAAFCLVKEFAHDLRRKYVAPQAPQLKPVVLTNETVLTTGISAGVLLHPFLPICILGYQQLSEL